MSELADMLAMVTESCIAIQGVVQFALGFFGAEKCAITPRYAPAQVAIIHQTSLSVEYTMSIRRVLGRLSAGRLNHVPVSVTSSSAVGLVVSSSVVELL